MHPSLLYSAGDRDSIFGHDPKFLDRIMSAHSVYKKALPVDIVRSQLQLLELGRLCSQPMASPPSKVDDPFMNSDDEENESTAIEMLGLQQTPLPGYLKKKKKTFQAGNMADRRPLSQDSNLEAVVPSQLARPVRSLTKRKT